MAGAIGTNERSAALERRNDVVAHDNFGAREIAKIALFDLWPRLRVGGGCEFVELAAQAYHVGLRRDWLAQRVLQRAVCRVHDEAGRTHAVGGVDAGAFGFRIDRDSGGAQARDVGLGVGGVVDVVALVEE